MNEIVDLKQNASALIVSIEPLDESVVGHFCRLEWRVASKRILEEFCPQPHPMIQ
jgi:hypothetical protein